MPSVSFYLKGTEQKNFSQTFQLRERKSLRGILAGYADTELMKLEKNAWEREAMKKYGNP